MREKVVRSGVWRRREVFGDATLYLGDCMDILPTLADGEFDLVATDPPYGIDYSRGADKARASAARGGIAGDKDTTARDEALAAIAPAACAVFGSLYAPFPANVRHVCIWQKRADSGVYGAMYGFRRDVEALFLCGDLPRRTVKWSSVLTGFPQPRNQHPHAKPVDLCRWIIAKFEGAVIDPFMGSGTTGVAALQLNRKFTGIEIEEKYFEIACRRIEAVANQGVLFK